MRWPLTPQERLWQRVDRSGECWIWTGVKTPLGYGRMYYDGRLQYVHRISYVWAKGAIPDGTEIDHLCRTRACVRPDHLEAVSHRLNTLRGNGFCALAARGERPAGSGTPRGHAETCRRGHPRIPENVHVDQCGQWKCRVCERERGRRRYADKRTARGYSPAT